MISLYKIIYETVDRDRNSSDFGVLQERSVEFKDFREAVTYSRNLSNTNLSIRGRPIIEVVNR